MISIVGILINLLIGTVIGYLASKLLKLENGPVEWLVIGLVGTVFGYLIAWALTKSGIAELALAVTSTFMGSCLFIVILKYMKK